MNAACLRALFYQAPIALVGVLGIGFLWVPPSLGQSLATCSPPVTGEFILLVNTPTSATESQLKQVLPPNVIIPVCDYLGNRVSRMGGFRSLTDANAWAEYITQSSGLQAFVAQSPQGNDGTLNTTANTAVPNPPSLPNPLTANPSASGIPTYNPQPLGSGYAVIVDFFNNPGIAVQLRTTQQRSPGLVSYGGRSYLLANYTADSRIALGSLQQLSQQGFQVLLVDSRQAVLLTPEVRLP